MMLILAFCIHIFLFQEIFRTKLSFQSSFLQNYTKKKQSEHEVPRLLESLAQGIRAGLNTEGAFKRIWEDKNSRGECLVLLGKIIAKLNSGSHISDAVTISAQELPAQPELVRLRQALLSLASLQRSGGDAARMLTEASEAARRAIFLKRRASALAAQMKFQAIVISLAPSGVAVVLMIVSPSSLEVFWQDIVGATMSFILVAANLTGIFFLSKIARSWER